MRPQIGKDPRSHVFEMSFRTVSDVSREKRDGALVSRELRGKKGFVQICRNRLTGKTAMVTISVTSG